MTVITDLHFVSSPQASKVWIQNKMDESKHEIHSQVDAITAGTASVVNLTAGQWHWHMLENCIWTLQEKKTTSNKNIDMTNVARLQPDWAFQEFCHGVHFKGAILCRLMNVFTFSLLK